MTRRKCVAKCDKICYTMGYKAYEWEYHKLPYILSMIFLLAFYICVVINMKRMKNKTLWNYIFSIAVALCYLYVVARVYGSVGFNDWNFQNTLPVANVSPFMFTLVCFIHLIPLKVRKHLYLLISLLSLGMLLSSVLGCIYNAYINYKFHLHFLSDYFAHVFLSLWGVYLIKSCQVELNKKNFIVSSGIIVGVAFTMLTLNVIFDTAFFGLSLNGKHNIYNNVLTENSYLSAVLYFLGLVCVLGIGYLYSYFLSRTNKLKLQLNPSSEESVIVETINSTHQ